MKILALIPAREGSRRLPNKNKRILGTKPLVSWTIKAAQGINHICRILVSTDDEFVAHIASEEGAYVPWLRPKELATDHSTSVEVAIHALDWYEEYIERVDGLLLLQPTSPFRRRETIERGIDLFKESMSVPVVGVSPARSHPQLIYKKEGEFIYPYFDPKTKWMRAQDLSQVLEVNGSLYLVSCDYLREFRSFGESKAIPLIVNSEKESIDIDTHWDFELAQYLIDKEY
jgi:CMP-N-acetylneuraminic acid synthetase